MKLGIAIIASFLTSAMTSGCTSDRLYRESVESAENGIYVTLEATMSRTAELIERSRDVTQISDADLELTFINDIREIDPGSRSLSPQGGLFALTAHADGTVSFDILLSTAVFDSAGMTSVNVERHACGSLRGRFGERVVLISDLDCPPDVEALVGEDSVPVSIEQVVQSHERDTNGAA